MSIMLSLKMDEKIYKTTEGIVKTTKTSRNAYINRAVDFFNRLQKRKELAKDLKRESEKVSSESMATLHAFEVLEDDHFLA